MSSSWTSDVADWMRWRLHINDEMIYEMDHIWTADMKSKWSYDPRSCECNFCNCVEKAEKFRTSTTSTSRYRCDAITNWAMSYIYVTFIVKCFTSLQRFSIALTWNEKRQTPGCCSKTIFFQLFPLFLEDSRYPKMTGKQWTKIKVFFLFLAKANSSLAFPVCRKNAMLNLSQY